MKSNHYQRFPYMDPNRQDRTFYPDLGDLACLPDASRPHGCRRIPDAMPVQKNDLYPFYYPLDLNFVPKYGYDYRADSEKDLRYIKQLYPCSVRKIQNAVEREVDKLVYEGSPIFDEYPDKESLYLIAGRIHKHLADADKKQEDDCPDEESKVMSTHDNFYFYMVLLLLYHEILHRRSTQRSHKQWW